MDLLPVTVSDIGIMNGLVGIIIVTNSSRGHHFVYKYPREQQHNSNNVRHPSHRPPESKSKPAAQQAEEFQVTSKILGYDPQFLANLLSPKLALCDKRFQLTVDDLTFVGHPVSLAGPDFRQRRGYWKWKAARPPKQRVKRGWIVGTAPFMDDDESDSDDYYEESNDDTDSARGSISGRIIKEGKETQLRRGSKDEGDIAIATRSLTDPIGWRNQRFRSQTYNSNPSSPASGDSPLSAQTSQQQTPSLTQQSNFGSSLLHHPVSMPQTPTGGIQSNFHTHLGVPPPIQITQGLVSNAIAQNASTPSSHHQQMSFFHVVFVLKPPELQINSVADQVYKNIACKLTAALRYEELNSQYVSKEAAKILSIREEATQALLSFEKFHEQVLTDSSLARAVRSIYECITADKVCHVVLNDSIDISLQIPHLAPLQRTATYFTRQIQSSAPTESPTGTPSSGQNGYNASGSQQALMTPMTAQYGGLAGIGYIMDDYEIGIAYEYENFPVLLPYHTLLLLEDPEEILKDIPLDANPTLVKLVQILVPYQCLDELQYILDCSMAQIYRLASHLIYWRKAKLIDQIRVSNVYVVAPQAEVNEALVTDFSQHFPTISLPNILHELSTPKAYKAHIPGAGKDKEVQTVYLDLLTYLLRKDLIVQLHTYILVLVPEFIKTGCTAEEYDHMMGEENSGALTPTLESPTVIGGGQTGSAKSADFAQMAMMQQHQQQQQQTSQRQQAHRYHNRSSTGSGAQGGPASAGAGMSSSLKSHLSMPLMKLMGMRQDASSIMPNPGQASEMEREWMVRMCENQPQSVAELFMSIMSKRFCFASRLLPRISRRF
ncbi:nitrogen permease regulator of amino acid transport activity 3-domain-containing protein [Gamsiella multidivaricata]|uniref:nitrogen permease regulator of amino acid transport activity 3-domain-containing protein n=1 Tax=Gamsiella multidivaricata TaxID=101098 RepID=UPI002220CA6F|nr:nitrogen permease regulator of amino acid transport activity 3-domain-containing protein [Gamsiella multidivaricata]KAI7831455.1 nitrogen permease regulator of amino acid transport activity 3-domain-containing protein [Gamsiella multidivaricata]